MSDPARLHGLMERRSRLALGRISADLARAVRAGQEAALLQARLAALLADQADGSSTACDVPALQRRHAQLARLTEAAEVARNRAAHLQAEAEALARSAAAETHRRDLHAEAALRAGRDAAEADAARQEANLPWRPRQ